MLNEATRNSALVGLTVFLTAQGRRSEVNRIEGEHDKAIIYIKTDINKNSKGSLPDRWNLGGHMVPVIYTPYER